MNNFIYISLNCIYFLFCVLLVNTIKKEFFNQSENKIIQTNSQNIFIPNNRESSSIYISQLLKSTVKPKYIFMLPLSDILVSKSALWNHLRGKYYHNITYLNNFVLPSFILENYLDRRLLEEIVYRKNQKFPINLILSKRNNKFNIFRLESKLDFFNLISEYREKNYNIIQKIPNNIFFYQSKILTLEIYILIVKENGNIKMYVHDYIKYLLLDINKQKYIPTLNVELIFRTVYFQNQYQNIIKNLHRNLSFIKKNLKEYLLNEKILGESVCFELFRANYFLNTEFKLNLYDFKRKINLISDTDQKKYMEIVCQTYNLVRGNSKLEDTNFLEVS